jgi:hypothetical protein
MTLRNHLQQLAPHKAPITLIRLLLAATILGGVLLCSVIILAGTLLSSGGRQAGQEGLAALAPLRQVCFGGAGLPQAAAYSPGPGPRRVVVFRSNIAGSADPSTFYNRSADYPANWQAADLPQAGLVACVHTGSVVVEECAYTLGDGARAILQRVRSTALVELYAAQTAGLVARGELPGAEPRACQPQEQFTGAALTQAISGDAVSPAQIQAWLSGYVE